jgi:hypothetical protein
MKRLALAIALLCLPSLAVASGGGISIPWTVDPYGGPQQEQDSFYNGHPGILLNRAPWARLFAAWRMLHGMAVGTEAGKSLARPCCGNGYGGADDGIKLWLAARAAVADVPKKDTSDIDAYRSVGDFAAVQTCFNDAFTTAAKTLQDRIAAHGATDPGVKTWVLVQDAVFSACSGKDPLPALPANAADWLRADYAYQNGAVALYQRDFSTAETRFLAIANDAASPWAKFGPYLAARAAVTAALPTHDTVAFDHAKTLLAALDPPDAYGHAAQASLLGALAFRQDPGARRKALGTELQAATLPPDTVAGDFKDSRRLGQSPAGDPAYLDWIAVFGRAPDKPEAAWFDHFDADQVWKTDADALAHARAKWTETHDPAWLIAAMIWSDPGDAAADLVTAAKQVAPDQPAYLTALYHRIRLAGPQPSDQKDLETALARTDLALSDRNLLLAERTLALQSLDDLTRLGARESPCAKPGGEDKGCLVLDYGMEDLSYSPIRPDIRFGEDAMVMLDRLPMQQRASLASAPLPPGLVFDVGFTTWVRAVLSMDYVTADRLIPALRNFLPQLDKEWTTYLAAKPGEDKRFAAWFILAKVPGAATDLRGSYTRPQGTVADFDGHWPDWLYAPAGAAPVPPDAIAGDIICYGLCGPGAFPVAMPSPVAALADKAATERGRFMPADKTKAGSVWEDVLSYAKAHPADPRSPEALYWLVRVSRFGTGHNRSSYRAFMLLHDRYKATQWAKDSKYFYD